MARSTARLFLHVGATFLPSSVCPALAPAQTVSFTASEITGSAGPGSVAVADFNGDGKQDLAVAELNPGSVSVLLGQGDGTFQAAPDVRVGVCALCLFARFVAVDDFNGDGVPDLAVVANHFVLVFLGNRDGTFPALPNGGAPRFFEAPSSLAVGDFNGDGVPDLAVAESAQRLEGVYVFFGNGDGKFTSGAKLLVGIRPPRSLAVGDFNGDGVADLAVTALGSLNVWVLLSNGDGTFEPERSFDVGCGPTAIAVGDLNGDAALDLAMASNYGKCSVLLGQGDGSFRAAEHLDAGTAGVATAIAVDDFNRDRVPDLAVASWVSNSVSVLLG